MLFAIHAVFRPDVVTSAELHEAFSAHLMQPILQIRLAGPLCDAAGVRTGILMIIDAPSEDAVRDFTETSPYAKAGLYQHLYIDRLEPEVGRI